MITDQELIDFTRWWLGGVDDSVITDAELQIIIDMVLIQYPDATDCQLKYYTVYNTLKYLIRKEEQGNSGSQGAVSEREEIRGPRKIRVKYGTSSSDEVTKGYQKLLDDLIANPNGEIGCEVFPPDTSSSGLVKIANTKNRFETSAPWRRNLNGK